MNTTFIILFSIISSEPISLGAWLSLLGGILLLCLSALMSSSETAFFSLKPADIDELESSGTTQDKTILSLLENPQILLATILIANNFVNIALTLLLAVFTSALFDFGTAVWAEFVINTIVITFLLLLFGEITPKVFATLNPLKLARFTCIFLQILTKLFYPFAWMLSKSTTVIERRMDKVPHANLSMDELSQAVELTEIATEEEKEILEGITKFGSIQASDIMRPRLDIVDIDIKSSFAEMLEVVRKSGYSRIPVYAGTSDKIKGILYSKDLLPHLDKPQNFRWQTLIRPAYFVPESKHLDDLLSEFQAHKVHLAIVVDEYGGIAGLVTLEDILEEIVGNISDEYDEAEDQYTREQDGTYLFDGKIMLNDFYKVLDIDEDTFAPASDEVETLAGLVLELRGDFLKRGEKVTFQQYEFEVVALEKRRIKSIRLRIAP